MGIKFASGRNAVRRFREEQHLTQQALANQVGIQRFLLSLIETGRVMATPEIAEKIAAVFGKPVEAIFDTSA